MPQVKLTNGAAQWALGILNGTKSNLDDLFVSGSLAMKFRSARIAPKQNEGEPIYDYSERVECWLFAPLADCGDGTVEVSQEEYEFMRGVLKDLGGRKELPANFHVAELASAFSLKRS